MIYSLCFETLSVEDVILGAGTLLGSIRYSVVLVVERLSLRCGYA